MKTLTFNTKYFVIAGLLGLMSGPVTADVPNTFTAGDTIRASEMNANFGALDTRITANEALEARITALETHVADTANPHSVDKTQVGLGNVENSQVRFAETTSPTATDDSNAGYAVATLWINTSTTQAYVLVDATAGAAVWKQITRSYAVGDAGPAGGKVFYTTDGGLHGLEAAPVDQTSTPWGCYGTILAGANGTAVGSGAQNTADIIALCLETTAATVAGAYTLNGYTDWFLPSRDELELMWTNLADSDGNLSVTESGDAGNLGGFVTSSYWSSTQDTAIYAWCKRFDIGMQSGWYKDRPFAVRAVRAF